MTPTINHHAAKMSAFQFISTFTMWVELGSQQVAHLTSKQLPIIPR